MIVAAAPEKNEVFYCICLETIKDSEDNSLIYFTKNRMYTYTISSLGIFSFDEKGNSHLIGYSLNDSYFVSHFKTL